MGNLTKAIFELKEGCEISNGPLPCRGKEAKRNFQTLPKMSDPLIHACDDYVVLEPGKREEFLNKKETLLWLEGWLKRLSKLPEDLQTQPSPTAAAQRLLDTACDLEIRPGFNLQWFAVRLDPPED